MFGMIPSPPDERDWHVPEVMMVGQAEPIRTPHRAKPRNQGIYGTCAAEAMAQWVEANELRERGVSIEYSEGDIYAGRDEADHQGEGMIPRQMLKWQMRHGAVRKSMFDFRNNYPAILTERAKVEGYLKDEGLASRIRGFVRLRTLPEIYTYMKEFEVGVLFGSLVDSGYSFIGADGIIPPYSGPSRGGHIVYAPDIVEKNGRLMLALQNSWGPRWGDNGTGYIVLEEAGAFLGGTEIWGPLPDDSSWYKDMPEKIHLSIYPDGRDNSFMYVDNARVNIPLGPFYHKGVEGETKLCTALREPFEAMGAKVEWNRLENGVDHIVISPRKGAILK